MTKQIQNTSRRAGSGSGSVRHFEKVRRMDYGIVDTCAERAHRISSPARASAGRPLNACCTAGGRPWLSGGSNAGVRTYRAVSAQRRGYHGTLYRRKCTPLRIRAAVRSRLRPEGHWARSARDAGACALQRRPACQSYITLPPATAMKSRQAGRLQEFHQFGVEMLGSSEPVSDAEVICTAKSIFDRLGLRNLSLEINSVGCPTAGRNITARWRPIWRTPGCPVRPAFPASPATRCGS